jgi:hypothetical protein
MKDNLVKILYQILKSDFNKRGQLVFNFIEAINNDDSNNITQQELDILIDLSFDIEPYEANPERRRQDPSYFGDEKLEELIKEALEKIEE